MKNSSEPEHFLSLRFRDDKRIRFGLGHCGCKDADSLQVLSVESIYNTTSKWMETFYICILVTAFHRHFLSIWHLAGIKYGNSVT